jgi:hypothetical protein
MESSGEGPLELIVGTVDCAVHEFVGQDLSLLKSVYISSMAVRYQTCGCPGILTSICACNSRLQALVAPENVLTRHTHTHTHTRTHTHHEGMVS